MQGRGRAGGKVILLGEHVVVYGRPAIAAGLPIGVEVEVAEGDGPALATTAADIADDVRLPQLVAEAAALVGVDPKRVVATVQSELPPGRGLGSSAALCMALLRALAVAADRRLTPAEELDHGRRLEAVFHGTPSGVDPATSALGGCIRFVRGEPPTVTPLRPGAALTLVVAFPGQARSTGAAVGGLRARWQAEPARYEALFDAVARVVDAGGAAIAAGDLAALGRAFDANQVLLEQLGVSAPETAALLATARSAGALGAKLTGGGAGGAIIALAPEPEPISIALRKAGAHTLVTRIAAPEAGT